MDASALLNPDDDGQIAALLGALQPNQDDAQSSAMLAALRKQQAQQQDERASLENALAQQQGQAGGLRTLSLLTSLGQNPLLQGIQHTAGEQGAQMESLAARTEGRLGQTGGKMSLLDVVRAQQAQRRLEQAAVDERRKQELAAKNTGFNQDLATQRLSLERERLAADRQAREATQAQKAAGEKIPAGEAASLGQVDAAIAGIRQLGQQFDALGAEGLPAIALAKVPGSNQQQYQALSRAAMQAVGTILEGGKLAAGDEVKYAKMLPALGDTKAIKQAKVENLVRMLEQAKSSKVEGLGRAGYDVHGFAARPPDVDLNAPAPTRAPASAATAPTGGNEPRIVSVKGMKPGDLVASLQEGETVRVPMGGGKYQTVRKKGGKLVKVKE